ncbi:MAG TPA: PAS domain S-box protein [Elusimicrobiota bacterium]|nr:PAS domain S-box protein [Elusimicrobiota bacterium]
MELLASPRTFGVRLWITGSLFGLVTLALSFWVAASEWNRFAATPGFSEAASAEFNLHLSGLSRSVFSYLNSHDAEDLDHIKIEGHDLSLMAGRFKAQLPRGQNVAGIDSAFENLRGATVDLISAETSQSTAFAAFTESGDALTQFLHDRFQANLRPYQLSAYTRQQLILEAGRQVKSAGAVLSSALMHRSGSAEALHSVEEAYTAAMDQYDQLSRSRSVSAARAEADGMFTRMMSAARQTLAAQRARETARDRFLQAVSDVPNAVQTALAVVAAARPTPWQSTGPIAALAFWVLAGATVGFGFVFRRLVAPLRELALAVEAAAAGDTTREFRVRGWDEVGRLGIAVNRLIGVLGRSENLVYHLATLVESTTEAIVSHDLEGGILSWNKGAQRLFGYSSDEVRGDSILLLSPRDGGAQLRAVLARLQRGEKVKPFDARLEGKNGRIAPVFIRVAVICDSTKKIIGATLCAQETAPAELPAATFVSGDRAV